MLTNQLYFGDNLDVLRDHIPDESIDLIYLDPPFNSKRDYNLLYNTPKGEKSEAQVVAFKDTWSWTADAAEREYEEVVRGKNAILAQALSAFRLMYRETSTMAYLTMMARRLIELHRVLKPTGSFYLHCDSSANHHLRFMLDAVFGIDRFQNDIIWKRTSAHNSAKKFGPIHDTIFFYTKTERYTWNPANGVYDEEHIQKQYRNVEEGTGRRYTLGDLTGAGTRKGETGLPWHGINITEKKRHWMSPPRELDALEAQGLIVWPKNGQMPRLKRYLDEMGGMQMQDVWTDIKPLGSHAKERLGYPTQKPLALLERIINASSKPGDVVLDPFCGCGTAVHAAQKLDRKWIGIDITHLAVELIEHRLNDAFPGILFTVEGTPKDLDGARDLARRDKMQFESWARSLVNAQPHKPNKKGGSDGGVDGIIFFTDLVNGKPTTKKGIVSVKGGGVTLPMIKDLVTTVPGNDAQFGLFVTLHSPTQAMIAEAAKAGFFTAGNGRQYPVIQILTIDDLLAGSSRPEYFDASRGEQTFKRAPIEEKRTLQAALL